MENLITVLTPAYNAAGYIDRLFDSLLIQTYPNVEIILVDDGSVDNTHDIVEDYIPRFEAKGYQFKYIFQENAGQSVAVKNGLQYVRGKYLVWPDSDDFYATPNALECMANALNSSGQDFAMVRTQENVLEDKTLNRIDIYGKNAHAEESKDLFIDCLLSKNGFYYTPGAYMIDFECFKDYVDIYVEHAAGQNWQIMLPVLYHYRCITILEPLYSIVERKDSHSRGMYEVYERKIEKFKSFENTIIETLKRLDMPQIEYQYYEKIIKRKYEWHCAFLALYNNEKDDYVKFISGLQEQHLINHFAFQVLCFSPLFSIYHISCFTLKKVLSVYRKCHLWLRKSLLQIPQNS